MQGTIVSFVRKSCGNRSKCKTTYSKILEYKIDNQKKSFETTMSETNSLYIVGSQVSIFYNPENNKEGFIDDNSILIFPLAFRVATLFFSFFYFSLLFA